MTLIKRLRTSTRGATLVEYGVIVGLLSIASIGSVAATGVEVKCVFERAAYALGADFNATCDLSGAYTIGEETSGGGSEEEVVNPRPDPLVAVARDPSASGVLGPYGYNDADFTFGDGADDALAVVDPYFGAYGADGADTLTGTTNGDVLIGGPGDDELDGDIGSDTYAWKTGDGYDSIIDEGDTNELFLADLLLDDVIFFRSGQSNNPTLVIYSKSGNAADQALLQVQDQYYSDTRGVQKVSFSDGTTLDANGIRRKMIDDTLDYTTTGWLRLPPEADTVVWEPLTDRNITVYDLGFDESVNDVVELHGYAESDITVVTASTQYHEVRLSVPNGKTITFIGQNQNGTGGVEILRFFDSSGNMTSEVDPNSYY
jgi:Flp pilus assembly pilin Flp